MIFFDVETGGLCPEKNGLVSVAFLDGQTLESFHYYVAPGNGLTYEAEAERVHGISVEYLAKKGREEGQVLAELAEWLKGRSEDWMGANPAFDVGFLRAAKKRTGAKLKIQQRVINLQDLAWMADRLGVIELPEKNGRRSRSLDSILESLGMTRGTLDGPHDALEDCLATFRAWRRLNALWLMKTEVRHE